MNTQLVDMDDQDARQLHVSPFQMRHGLAAHPLFSLDRLVELAKSMPGDALEYNSGRLQPGVKPQDVPGIDLPAEQVIRQISECGAWMVIKGVERDAAYRALLEQFVDELAARAGMPRRHFRDLKGFVFVSSAGSTTPFHFDAEENVLVQVHGEKFVHIFDNEDRALLSEEALEISPSKHRNQPYEERFEARASVHALKPGDAVHIPYTWPHWVRTGNSYTISMAMTWKTPEVERLNKIRLINGTLRRFGAPQAAPGRRPLADAAKVALHDAARMLVDPLRRSDRVRAGLRGLVYGRSANYYLRKSGGKA